MTAFFVLSGYVIYYTYQKKDLGKLANIKLFYKKDILQYCQYII